MKRARGAVALMLVLCGSVMIAEPSRPAHAGGSPAQVEVLVDLAVRYQTMEGFGSNIQPFDAFGQERLSATMRQEILEAVYRKVGLTHARVNGTSLGRTRADRAPQLVRDLRGLGVSVDYLDTSQPPGGNLDTDRLVESIMGLLVHYRDAHGITFGWVSPFSEPSHRRMRVTTEQCVEVVKRLGGRLEREGFSRVKLLVPDDITVETSLEKAARILADPEARRYVGAIGYHPYNGTYEDPAWILRTSARGTPDPGEVERRAAIRSLGQRYGVPVWMTEVSYSRPVTVDGFSLFLARVNNVFDDLEFAHAAAWYGMHAFWQDAGGEHGPRGGDQAVVAFRFDAGRGAPRWEITPTGYAIGHYARWLRNGSIRVRAVSRDALVRVQAFHEPGSGALVFVAINDDGGERRVRFSLASPRLTLEGAIRGERSTAAGYWKPLRPLVPSGPASLEISLPARSVTTLVGSVRPA